MTSAQAKKAREDGKARAARKRRKEAVKRVKDFKKWLSTDGPLFGQMLREEITRKAYYSRRPKMPEVPSDNDYALYRQETS